MNIEEVKQSIQSYTLPKLGPTVSFPNVGENAKKHPYWLEQVHEDSDSDDGHSAQSFRAYEQLYEAINESSNLKLINDKCLLGYELRGFTHKGIPYFKELQGMSLRSKRIKRIKRLHPDPPIV